MADHGPLERSIGRLLQLSMVRISWSWQVFAPEGVPHPSHQAMGMNELGRPRRPQNHRKGWVSEWHPHFRFCRNERKITGQSPVPPAFYSGLPLGPESFTWNSRVSNDCLGNKNGQISKQQPNIKVPEMPSARPVQSFPGWTLRPLFFKTAETPRFSHMDFRNPKNWQHLTTNSSRMTGTPRCTGEFLVENHHPWWDTARMTVPQSRWYGYRGYRHGWWMA